MMQITARFGPRRLWAIFLLASLMLAGAATAQPAALAWTPPAGSFNCGGTWTVDITTDAGTTDLRGFSLVLEFDNSVIAPLSVSVGPMVSGAACPNFLNWVATTGADSLEVDVANLGCSVAGPGTILTVVFDGVLSGTSAIGVRSGMLRTGSNAPIAFTSSAASVEYDCAVATEPMAWGALKAYYR